MATDFTVIDRILEDYRSRGYYPSAVCQVFRGNETLYRCAVGDVTPETWFDLASVSKLICTTMVLSLIHIYSTKKNLEMRVDAENGATAGKFELAKKAKELGLDAIHDTVHEICLLYTSRCV